MEKIKQALDRARDNRISKTSLDKDRVVMSKDPESDFTSNITYTKTKSVELSQHNLREKRVIIGDINDSVSDQYKVLRTHVLQKLKANQWNSLAITSPTEGCGKTLTSINLAISLAREVNHSVLLVDLDLRRPSIQNYFFNDEQPGISEYLNGNMELSEVLFNPGLDRLVILPGNKPFSNSSEMLSSPKMVQLVEDLKSRYPNRMVIFDMPPLLSCDDVIAFSPYIDSVMLVIEEGVTRKDELKRAIDLLGDTNMLGTVLNKSKASGLSYGSY
ncbi:MAG: CpsD/CapB family tyrosine-protein kinase [Candidatus Thiodiazotropha taylori]|nr:CpsD/CapB family tyrosine-protein kinase [Candidatus Thiodiazotropha taylori]MCG7963053.1 CpsD/CapB family tyrosine-protein kinase [Candidatus Thiodiazotropha endolucinida]RLW54318.1 MAG: exopolysaccharide biosynthesis protein [gamma proteobacterium symbiont of Stewartia floridana]MCG7910130.1 CpsD/CapB family tyrosine-protein kinase [Candidatus Thiodiazotropha taylori]MCG8071360.1 CpsD/CapB family tyrosine-protein kinase [Candidatus Thiodiazotropha taylori]